MTKEQLVKLSSLYSIEFKCVVFIMDMLRRGQIKSSTPNQQVYDMLVSKLDECSGVTASYEEELERMRRME